MRRHNFSKLSRVTFINKKSNVNGFLYKFFEVQHSNMAVACFTRDVKKFISQRISAGFRFCFLGATFVNVAVVSDMNDKSQANLFEYNSVIADPADFQPLWVVGVDECCNAAPIPRLPRTCMFFYNFWNRAPSKPKAPKIHKDWSFCRSSPGNVSLGMA